MAREKTLTLEISRLKRRILSFERAVDFLEKAYEDEASMGKAFDWVRATLNLPPLNPQDKPPAD
jgi:hypothetical protein